MPDRCEPSGGAVELPGSRPPAGPVRRRAAVPRSPSRSGQIPWPARPAAGHPAIGAKGRHQSVAASGAGPCPIAANRPAVLSSCPAMCSLTSASSGVPGRRMSSRENGDQRGVLADQYVQLRPGGVDQADRVVGEVRSLDDPRPGAGLQAGGDVLAVLLMLIPALPRPEGKRSANSSSGNTSALWAARNANMLPWGTRCPASISASRSWRSMRSSPANPPQARPVRPNRNQRAPIYPGPPKRPRRSSHGLIEHG